VIAGAHPARAALAAALLLVGMGVRAQSSPADRLESISVQARSSPVGLWETISDRDGKPKGHVRIVEANGELRGTIEEIVDPNRRADVCDKCPGDRANKPVLGLTILTGLKAQGDAWTGGEILDPNNGKIYACRVRLIDGGRHLEVRGYIGISLLGRTQTWNRLEEAR
jgi:uncharacterized protein (DUF2147 family)